MQSEDKGKKMKCECCDGETDAGLDVCSGHPLDGEEGAVLLRFPAGDAMEFEVGAAISLAMDILSAARDVLTLDVDDVKVDEGCYDA